MMFAGLGHWVDANWILQKPRADNGEKSEPQSVAPNDIWVPRSRPVLKSLGIMIVTHVAGVILFFLRTQAWFVAQAKVSHSP